jgi:hypothetical protein
MIDCCIKQKERKKTKKKKKNKNKKKQRKKTKKIGEPRYCKEALPNEDSKNEKALDGPEL